MIITDYQCFKVIVNKLSDYFLKNKIHSVIIGISGGIDSTVVAALLYHIKKRINSNLFEFKIYGYSLPTSTTDEKEYYVSTVVGNTFCDNFKTVNISNITEQISTYLQIGAFPVDAFREGNVKARFRMMFLYDKAKYYKGCVVGTDNYTEKLLGFSTIGGDDTADIMPIQNLWKTEVYRLAEHLCQCYFDNHEFDKFYALDQSIQLTPQDGLGISKSDMDQLGAKDYYEVDEILYDYINGKNIEELCKNHLKNTVHQITTRYNNNFKLKLPITITRDEFEA